MKLYYFICLPFIVLAVLTGFYLAFNRMEAEKELDTVCMVMDYDDWEAFCVENGYDLEESLLPLKEKGISYFGVYENNCKRLELKGQLSVLKGSDILNAYRFTGLSNPLLKSLLEEDKIAPDNIYILFPPNSPYLDNVIEYFTRFFGPSRVKLHEKGVSLLEVEGDYYKIMNAGIGMPDETVHMLSNKGFFIVPRMENRDLNEENLEFVFNNLKNTPGCSVVIFSGMENEVLGYPDFLKETGRYIKDNDFYFGYVEVPVLSNLQKGTMTLAACDITRVIRVISITQAYQQKLSLDRVMNIWSLAVRERNIRLLYMRPLLEPIDDMNLMESNLHYLQLCKDEIEAAGYKTGKAMGMAEVSCPLWASILLGLGVISACLLLAGRIFQVPFKYVIFLASLAILILFGGFLVKPGLFSKLFALASAITFPLFAMVFGFSSVFVPGANKDSNENTGTFKAIVFSLKTVWLVSLICTVGAIVSIGFLNSTPFFLAIDRFRGIKFLMTGPVFLVLLLYFYSISEEDKFNRFFKKFISFLKIPMELWQFILILILMAGGVFYITRTGNVPALTVSDFERDLRVFLDTVLVVRPRFKDFIIGIPSLFLGAYLWAVGKRKYIYLFLMLAALGQANMVDTFAHLHTPLKISLLRIFNGLWIGTLFGLFAIGIYNVLYMVYRKISYKIIEKA